MTVGNVVAPLAQSNLKLDARLLRRSRTSATCCGRPGRGVWAARRLGALLSRSTLHLHDRRRLRGHRRSASARRGGRGRRLRRARAALASGAGGGARPLPALAGRHSPLAGFVGKFYVFGAAVRAGISGSRSSACLNSAAAAYYYLRIIVYMYMREPEGDRHHLRVVVRGRPALAIALARNRDPRRDPRLPSSTWPRAAVAPLLR